MSELFSVAQDFDDGYSEYVRRHVPVDEAYAAFDHYTRSVGAQIGSTVRVLIEDGGGNTNMLWEHSKGLVFPFTRVHAQCLESIGLAMMENGSTAIEAGEAVAYLAGGYAAGFVQHWAERG